MKPNICFIFVVNLPRTYDWLCSTCIYPFHSPDFTDSVEACVGESGQDLVDSEGPFLSLNLEKISVGSGGGHALHSSCHFSGLAILRELNCRQ